MWSRRSGNHNKSLKLNLEELESRLVPTALINHGGPVLSSVQLVNVYAGGPTYDSLAPVAAGDYVALASPFGVGPGAYLGSVTVQNPGPISNAGVQAILAKEIAAGAIPQPGPNSLYMVSLSQPVTDAFAASDVAYHSWFNMNGQEVVYGVVWPSVVGTLGYTHEVIEAVTDPFANAWYGSGGLTQEAADVEGWQNFVVDNQKVCQFALPDGSPAGKPQQTTTATSAQPTVSTLSNLFALAIERLQEDVYGLLARINPAFARQAEEAKSAVEHNPLYNNPYGQEAIQLGDVVFANWVASL